MSDGTFHAYIGLLVLSALVLSVLAARGFGQPTATRVVYGLLGAGFLGYAGYLVVADPDTVRVLFYAFVAPVVALVHGVRSARAAKAGRLAALPHGAEPAAFQHGSDPAAFQHGSEPAAFQHGLQPAAFQHGPGPVAFQHGSEPTAYQHGPEPSGYRSGPGFAAVAAQPFPPSPSAPFGVPGAAPARVSGPMPSGLPQHRPAPAAGPVLQEGPAPEAGPVLPQPARSGLAGAYGAVPEDVAPRSPARPSGLRPAGPEQPASFSATAQVGPRPEPATDGRHRTGPGQTGYVPFRLGPDDFVDPGPSATAGWGAPVRYHAEPAAPADPPPPVLADRPGRHARGHAEPAPGRHRSPDADPAAASWPPPVGRT